MASGERPLATGQGHQLRSPMKPAYFLLALCITAAVSNSKAQTLHIQPKRLDSLPDSLYARHQYMGSLTLSQHGGIVYSHVNGFRQVSKTDSRPATLTTAYRIGSISKVFTSVMIFQLIGAKRLRLEDKIGRWFPKIPTQTRSASPTCSTTVAA